MTDRKQIRAILNRASGSGDADAIREHLEQDARVGVDIRPDSPDFRLEAWAGECAAAGATRLIVAGGDDSVGAIARCLVGTEIELAIIPVGTFNNIARSLHLPLDLAEATRVALGDQTDWMAAGDVDGHIFFEGMGLGLEASMFETGEAVKSGEFAEALSGAEKFFNSQPFRVRVALNNPERVIRAHGLLVTVSNAPSTGANVPLAPGADIRSETLHMTVYRDVGRPRLLLHLLLLRLRGRGLRNGIRRHTFTQGQFSSSDEVTVHADGEIVSSLPVTVKGIARAVRVVVGELHSETSPTA